MNNGGIWLIVTADGCKIVPSCNLLKQSFDRAERLERIETCDYRKEFKLMDEWEALIGDNPPVDGNYTPEYYKGLAALRGAIAPCP